MTKESYEVKIWRKGSSQPIVLTDEVISFEIERAVTTERSEARLRIDGEVISPNAFAEGDAIEVYVSSTGTLTKVFSGEIEEITRTREEGELYLDIVAHDWSVLLSERKVNLSYPEVTPVSDIVLEIVDPLVLDHTPSPTERGITVNNVEQVRKTRTLDFIGLTMYEALSKLSEYTACDFYLDENKDLHWFLRGSRDSGKTLTSSDLQNYDFGTDRTICNAVTVYGAPNRTLPEYDLDEWSDNLDGWYIAAAGERETLTVSQVPSKYTQEIWPGWDKMREAVATTQDLKIVKFTKVRQDWAIYGNAPWIDGSGTIESGGPLFYTYRDMEYWEFEKPDFDKFYQNLKEWQSVKLRIKAYTDWGIAWPSQVYAAEPKSPSELFTWYSGNVSSPVDKDNYKTIRFRFQSSSTFNGAMGAKEFSDSASCMAIMVYFKTPPVPADYDPDADVIIFYILTADSGILAAFSLRRRGSYWAARLFSADQVQNKYVDKMNETNLLVGETWYLVTLELYGAGTSKGSVRLEIKNVLTLRIDNINMSLRGRAKNVWMGAIWEGRWPRGSEVWDVYFLCQDGYWSWEKTLLIFASARRRKIYFYLYKFTEAKYLEYYFWIEDTQRNPQWLEFDITSTFADYQLLNYIRFKLEDRNEYEGIQGSQNWVDITEVNIRLEATMFQGNPIFLDTDDGDGTYIECNRDGEEDGYWTDFKFDLRKLETVQYAKIVVKGKNVSGTSDASCKLVIIDPTSGKEITLGQRTWTTSETNYTTKEWDVTSYLNTEYKLQNVRVKFVKVGSGKLRVTYMYIEVKYTRASGLFLKTDKTIKKAGTCSIKVEQYGDSGTISLTVWKELPSPVTCQTVQRKEGFTKLRFAALIRMNVESDKTQWERPVAKLAAFTVTLHDANEKKAIYSAGDLYPENTFFSIPGPVETKMKEISIEVGANAEANGLWSVEQDFDWTCIKRITFFVKGVTDTSVEGNPYVSYLALYLDWLHFAEGRWYAYYALPDSDPSVQTYGRSYEEIFDKTCFSYEDCYMRAKYYVELHKYPVDKLENVEVDYPGMELLRPGELIHFNLPEGTLTMRIVKIKWIWDGDLSGELTLDNEGIKTFSQSCPSGQLLRNADFEASGHWDFDGITNGHFEYFWQSGPPPHWSGSGVYREIGENSNYSVAFISTGGTIEQDLVQERGSAVNVSDVYEFSCYLYLLDWGSATFQFTITYTDNSTTVFTEEVSEYGAWVYKNMTNKLVTGKAIKAIKVEKLPGNTDAALDRLHMKLLPHLWTTSGGADVVSSYGPPYEGVFYAYISPVDWIEQTLTEPVPGACIKQAYFYSNGTYSPCDGIGTDFTVTVTYSDNTYDETTFTTASWEDGTWVKRDFLDIIDPNKIVTKIKIYVGVFGGYVDQVVLSCEEPVEGVW